MPPPASTFDFDPIAERYDRWYDEPQGAIYDRLEKRAVARLLPDRGRGGELLDVGCGTGHWARFFAKRGFRVTGIDISPSMVRLARAKAISCTSFIVADAHRLPFPDRRFDVVVAITTLEFVRDAEVVVREMARCVRRPGGILLVGALNERAAINRQRKTAGKPTYRQARFFTPRGLRALLSPWGRADLACVGFVPRRAVLVPLAPVAEALGRALRLPWGAFIVGRVVL